MNKFGDARQISVCELQKRVKNIMQEYDNKIDERRSK